MSEPKSSLHRLLGILTGVAAICAVAFVVLDRPSGDVNDGSTPGGSDPTSPAIGHRASLRYGGIASRPVDSASRPHEGAESDDWDTISRSERISRTERDAADMMREMKAAAPDDVELIRERALMTLSVARADFFATQAGKERYTQLERELEE